MGKSMQIKMLRDRVKELEGALDDSLNLIEKYKSDVQGLLSQKKAQENAFLKIATEAYILKKSMSTKEPKKTLKENSNLKEEIRLLKERLSTSQVDPTLLQENEFLKKLALENKTRYQDKVEENKKIKNELYLLKKELASKKDLPIQTPKVDNTPSNADFQKQILSLNEEIATLKEEIIRTRRISKKIEDFTPEVRSPSYGSNAVKISGF